MTTRPMIAHPDGHSTLLHHWPATSQPRGVVVIAHGMGEHAERYRDFATYLNNAGHHVYAFDHRGHGADAARQGTLGALGEGGFNNLVADFSRVLDALRDRHAAVPLVAFGHSMGSIVVQSFLLNGAGQVSAAILSGSMAVDVFGSELAELEGDAFAAFNSSFAPVRTGYDWLSRDVNQVDRYVADPLCGFAIDTKSFTSMLDEGTRLAEPAGLQGIRADLPLLVFSGTADPVGGKNASSVIELARRYQEAGIGHLTLKLYQDGRHEMLNETNRDEVFSDLVAWLERL